MKPNRASGLCSSQSLIGENRFLFARLKAAGEPYPKAAKRTCWFRLAVLPLARACHAGGFSLSLHGNATPHCVCLHMGSWTRPRGDGDTQRSIRDQVTLAAATPRLRLSFPINDSRAATLCEIK